MLDLRPIAFPVSETCGGTEQLILQPLVNTFLDLNTRLEHARPAGKIYS